MEHREEAFAAQATTNAFADLDEVIDKRGCRSAVLLLKNTDSSNVASYQVLGSINLADWAVVGASADIAALGIAFAMVDEAWPYFKVQVKAKVADSQATVTGNASVLAT